MTQNLTKIDLHFHPCLEYLGSRWGLPKYHRAVTDDRQQSANDGLIVNQMILDLTCKLFDSPDYDTIVAEMRDPFDGELLIDFNLLVRITFIPSFTSLSIP